MHIAASNPLALTSDLIDKSLIDKEQELVTEELKNSGKPEDIAKKMSYYYSSHCLNPTSVLVVLFSVSHMEKTL